MLCFELFGIVQNPQVIGLLTHRGKYGGSVLFQEMGTKFLIASIGEPHRTVKKITYLLKVVIR